MKKILSILIAFVFSISTFAQVTLTQEQYDKLPQEVKTTIQTTNKLQELSEYASWGQEIGIAIDGALNAIEDHVISLAETPLGHTAIFLVVWKLIYKDIIELVVGLLLLIVVIWLARKLIELIKTSDDQLSEEGLCVLEVSGWIAVGVFFIASMCCIF